VTGLDPMDAMKVLGTVARQEIINGIGTNNIGLPEEMSLAAYESQQLLSTDKDPQKCDIVIDKAMLSAMYRIAHEYDNAFFKKVVRSKIDIENIRSLVRIKRMGKDIAFLKSVLSDGGYIEIKKMTDVFPGNMRDIAAFIGNTHYGHALAGAFEGLGAGSRLTLFEKICDNFMLTFISEANRFTFGIEPILGYILEKENEITSVRMVMASKMSNIPAVTIIERLREYYAW
jgi:V/A-type H+-transporting ATPase subunit C